MKSKRGMWWVSFLDSCCYSGRHAMLQAASHTAVDMEKCDTNGRNGSSYLRPALASRRDLPQTRSVLGLDGAPAEDTQRKDVKAYERMVVLGTLAKLWLRTTTRRLKLRLLGHPLVARSGEQIGLGRQARRELHDGVDLGLNLVCDLVHELQSLQVLLHLLDAGRAHDHG